ncbi:hypothetical protein LY78DRAFT_664633 [Colletotrichum sublineola]|nr:hypothetical protein LY78DRAFT_664633 [Colletotrichum sublineola]
MEPSHPLRELVVSPLFLSLSLFLSVCVWSSPNRRAPVVISHDPALISPSCLSGRHVALRSTDGHRAITSVQGEPLEAVERPVMAPPGCPSVAIGRFVGNIGPTISHKRARQSDVTLGVALLLIMLTADDRLQDLSSVDPVTLAQYPLIDRASWTFFSGCLRYLVRLMKWTRLSLPGSLVLRNELPSYVAYYVHTIR